MEEARGRIKTPLHRECLPSDLAARGSLAHPPLGGFALLSVWDVPSPEKQHSNRQLSHSLQVFIQKSPSRQSLPQPAHLKASSPRRGALSICPALFVSPRRLHSLTHCTTHLIYLFSICLHRQNASSPKAEGSDCLIHHYIPDPKIVPRIRKRPLSYLWN